MKTFSIWQDDGDAVEIESESMTTALDDFCAQAGYIDHADYCQEMGLDASPFNIVEVAP